VSVYVVLMYPPHGAPRVAVMPDAPAGMEWPMRTFPTEAEAALALEDALRKDPEMRAWRDGHIQRVQP